VRAVADGKRKALNEPSNSKLLYTSEMHVGFVFFVNSLILSLKKEKKYIIFFFIVGFLNLQDSNAFTKMSLSVARLLKNATSSDAFT
jgi:hypothetical protein